MEFQRMCPCCKENTIYTIKDAKRSEQYFDYSEEVENRRHKIDSPDLSLFSDEEKEVIINGICFECQNGSKKIKPFDLMKFAEDMISGNLKFNHVDM